MERNGLERCCQKSWRNMERHVAIGFVSKIRCKGDKKRHTWTERGAPASS